MTITDQIGNLLTIGQTPQRIISLVPSQTELLVDLGLRDQLVGVTKFCVHPEDLRKEKEVVGGTKQVDYIKIAALHPDIILCNKEENTKDMVETLQKIAPVHVSYVKTVEESLVLIVQYGTIFRKNKEASIIIEAIEAEIINFSKSSKDQYQPKKVGYFIWKEPLMVVGANTFIDTLLEEIGFDNAFRNKEGRYPEVAWEDLKELDCVFLSSEPYPFKEAHMSIFQEKCNATIVLVNGEYFSWHGSRLIKAFHYFRALRSQLEL